MASMPNEITVKLDPATLERLLRHIRDLNRRLAEIENRLADLESG